MTGVGAEAEVVFRYYEFRRREANFLGSGEVWAIGRVIRRDGYEFDTHLAFH